MQIDEIDKIILINLGRNSRTSSIDITNQLRNIGYNITERAIRYRLKRLEKNNIILAYSTILNPNLVSEKVNKVVILKFKLSRKSTVLIKRLENYVEEAKFCIYASRLHGDFDWIGHFVFDSIEQYELESNNFINRFIDLVADYRSYDSHAVKIFPYTIYEDMEINDQKIRVYKILNEIKKQDSVTSKLNQTVNILVNYFDAKFARIWLLDKTKKYLILRFSAGKYDNISGEFSKVSINSNKIGTIIKTKKPTITNDLVNDKRIKYPEWVKNENLKSFAGYPLIYKNNAVGVVAMFSEKKLQPSDFEILGIFAHHVSNEISNFLETKEFLSLD